MKPKHLHVALLVSVAAARAAGADALDDFQAGTTVAVSSATVDVGRGPIAAMGRRGSLKNPGTLDLVLQAADLGIDFPITLHLHGVMLRDRQIEYTIDEATEADLGAGNVLTRLAGHIYVRAAPLAGTAKHTFGNVALRLSGPSALTAEGTWGRLAVAISELELLGGVAQPPLATFVDPGAAMICSDRVATAHTFDVSLRGVATASGAVVELNSPFDSGVHLPGGMLVRAGRQTASVTARIEANFVGNVRLAAAAGGGVQSLVVVIHSHGDCARR